MLPSILAGLGQLDKNLSKDEANSLGVARAIGLKTAELVLAGDESKVVLFLGDVEKTALRGIQGFNHDFFDPARDLREAVRELAKTWSFDEVLLTSLGVSAGTPTLR
jgi:hypothetical protein